jgi:hypothetical protein
MTARRVVNDPSEDRLEDSFRKFLEQPTGEH